MGGGGGGLYPREECWRYVGMLELVEHSRWHCMTVGGGGGGGGCLYLREERVLVALC